MNNQDVIVCNKVDPGPDLNQEFKEEILRTLRDGICEVTFKKVNGEIRIMPCTLAADLLPTKEQKDLTLEPLQERKGDVISVWCTDKQAWRSFKLSNLTGIKLL